MLLVYPNQGNYIMTFVDNLLTTKDLYRVKITKPEVYGMAKTFNITNFNYVDFNDNNYILQLFFCEVDLINETLIGDVCMHDWPGEWVMVIEGKDLLEVTWTEIYTDLMRCLPASSNMLIYTN